MQSGKSSLLFETRKPPFLQSAEWAADGRSIYYWRAISDDLHAVIQRDFASGTEKEMIRRPFLRSFMMQSPDGKYLAVTSVDVSSNSRTILLIPTDGTEPRELMRVPSEIAPEELKNLNKGQTLSEAFFMPDSRSLIVRKRRSRESDNELWHVSIDGSAPRKLDSPLAGNTMKFTLNQDGRTVAYRRNDPGPAPTREIWVLENFLPPANSSK